MTGGRRRRRRRPHGHPHRRVPARRRRSCGWSPRSRRPATPALGTRRRRGRRASARAGVAITGDAARRDHARPRAHRVLRPRGHARAPRARRGGGRARGHRHHRVHARRSARRSPTLGRRARDHAGAQHVGRRSRVAFQVLAADGQRARRRLRRRDHRDPPPLQEGRAERHRARAWPRSWPRRSGAISRRSACTDGRGCRASARSKEIGVMSLRSGDVVGEHTVSFGTLGERLELTHRAHSRDTFARGALRAARWIADAAARALLHAGRARPPDRSGPAAMDRKLLARRRAVLRPPRRHAGRADRSARGSRSTSSWPSTSRRPPSPTISRAAIDYGAGRAAHRRDRHRAAREPHRAARRRSSRRRCCASSPRARCACACAS